MKEPCEQITHVIQDTLILAFGIGCFILAVIGFMMPIVIVVGIFQ